MAVIWLWVSLFFAILCGWCVSEKRWIGAFAGGWGSIFAFVTALLERLG